MRQLLSPSTAALGALVLVGCTSTPIQFGGPTATSGVEVGVEGVVTRHRRVVAVEGYAHNRSSTDFERVEVYFDLLDGGGAKVGDASAETPGLRAGQTWRFDAPTVVKYRAKVRRIRVDRIELDVAARR